MSAAIPTDSGMKTYLKVQLIDLYILECYLNILYKNISRFRGDLLGIVLEKLDMSIMTNAP